MHICITPRLTALLVSLSHKVCAYGTLRQRSGPLGDTGLRERRIKTYMCCSLRYHARARLGKVSGKSPTP